MRKDRGSGQILVIQFDSDPRRLQQSAGGAETRQGPVSALVPGHPAGIK